MPMQNGLVAINVQVKSDIELGQAIAALISNEAFIAGFIKDLMTVKHARTKMLAAI